MRISDWSSDVCSSDLQRSRPADRSGRAWRAGGRLRRDGSGLSRIADGDLQHPRAEGVPVGAHGVLRGADGRSEEHTSELQSLMRISYAVFCLKKKKTQPDSTRIHVKDSQ